MNATHSTDRKPYRQVCKIGRCWGCDRDRPLQAHGCCKYCNVVLNMKVQPCRLCKRVLRTPTRGLCTRCARELPAELDGADLLRRREFTPGELAAAKSRERDFVDAIRPAVLRAAYNAFRRWPRDSRDEAVAESLALAWKGFISLVAGGGDPLTHVGVTAKNVIRNVRGWNRLCGKPSLDDALSPRAHWQGRVKALHDDRHGNWDKLQRPDEELERARWLSTLGCNARRVAEYLAAGNSMADAVAEFALTRDEVAALRAGDWEILG